MKAENVEVESYWPSLFAKLAEKKNIEDLIINVGAGGGGGGAPAVAAPAAGGAAAAAAPAAEEKKVIIYELLLFVINNFVSVLLLTILTSYVNRKKSRKRVMMIWVSAYLTRNKLLVCFSLNNGAFLVRLEQFILDMLFNMMVLFRSV